MEQINRPEYLQFLTSWKDEDVIKVVSGVRRCGKSTLFEMFKQQLRKEGVKEDQIISINFEYIDFDNLRTPTALNNYIKERIQESRSVEKVNLNSDFNISYFRSHDISTKSHCGNYREDTEDDNRDRTKLWVECYYENISGIPYVTGRGQIRPYKKTLGVWYYARRTITGRIKFDVSYTLNGQTEVYQFNQIVTANLSYTQSREFNEPTWPNVPSNVRFTHIDSWGDTPSTGTATIVCH